MHEDDHLELKRIVLKVKVEGKGTVCCIIGRLLYIDVLVWHATGCLNTELRRNNFKHLRCNVLNAVFHLAAEWEVLCLYDITSIRISQYIDPILINF
jgi:hypothetical protein